MQAMLESLDERIIHFIRKISSPLARIALFIVFFWFGSLKILDSSPANPLVADLLSRTLPFVTFEQFIIAFGVYEMIIGLAFLIPNLERLAIALLIPHMITTVLPLVMLTQTTWVSPFIPTLEGQYIIKNLVIIALALGLATHLRPWKIQRN